MNYFTHFNTHVLSDDDAIVVCRLTINKQLWILCILYQQCQFNRVDRMPISTTYFGKIIVFIFDFEWILLKAVWNYNILPQFCLVTLQVVCIHMPDICVLLFATIFVWLLNKLYGDQFYIDVFTCKWIFSASFSTYCSSLIVCRYLSHLMEICKVITKTVWITFCGHGVDQW